MFIAYCQSHCKFFHDLLAALAASFLLPTMHKLASVVIMPCMLQFKPKPMMPLMSAMLPVAKGEAGAAV